MDNILKIFASIIDYPQSNLPEDVWNYDKENKKYVLKTEVKQEILSRVQRFFAEKGFKNIDNFWVGTVIGSSIGSLFYATSTDIDVKVIIDLAEFLKQNEYDVGDQMWNMVKDVRKSDVMGDKNLLESTKRPLDIYFINLADFSETKIENVSERDMKKYDSLYYVEKDEWLKSPRDINDITKYVDERDKLLEQAYNKADKIAESIDLDRGKAQRLTEDILSFEKFINRLTPEQKSKLKSRLQSKLNELESALKDMIETKEEVTEDRAKAFKDLDFTLDYDKFITSLNYKDENLVMKILQKYGYFNLISKIQDIVQDEETDEIKVKEEDVPEIKEVVAAEEITAYHGSDKIFDKFSEQSGEPLFFSPDINFAKLHAQPMMYVVKLYPNKIFDGSNLVTEDFSSASTASEHLTAEGEILYKDLKNIYGEDNEWSLDEAFKSIALKNWDVFADKQMQLWLKEHGYDAFYERGEGAENIGILDENKIEIIDKYVVEDASGAETQEFSNIKKVAKKITIRRNNQREVLSAVERQAHEQVQNENSDVVNIGNGGGLVLAENNFFNQLQVWQELEYEYSKLKNDEANLNEDEKAYLAELELSLSESQETIISYMMQVFNRWIHAHTNRASGVYPTYDKMGKKEIFDFIIEHFKSSVLTFAKYYDKKYYAAHKSEKDFYKNYKEKLIKEERIEQLINYMNQSNMLDMIPKFLEQHQSENEVFEKIRDIASNLESARTLEEKNNAISLALNSVHNHGAMIQYFRVTPEQLEYLSNMDHSKWDTELGMIGRVAANKKINIRYAHPGHLHKQDDSKSKFEELWIGNGGQYDRAKFVLDHPERQKPHEWGKDFKTDSFDGTDMSIEEILAQTEYDAPIFGFTHPNCMGWWEVYSSTDPEVPIVYISSGDRLASNELRKIIAKQLEEFTLEEIPQLEEHLSKYVDTLKEFYQAYKDKEQGRTPSIEDLNKINDTEEYTATNKTGMGGIELKDSIKSITGLNDDNKINDALYKFEKIKAKISEYKQGKEVEKEKRSKGVGEGKIKKDDRFQATLQEDIKSLKKRYTYLDYLIESLKKIKEKGFSKRYLTSLRTWLKENYNLETSDLQDAGNKYTMKAKSPVDLTWWVVSNLSEVLEEKGMLVGGMEMPEKGTSIGKEIEIHIPKEAKYKNLNKNFKDAVKVFVEPDADMPLDKIISTLDIDFKQEYAKVINMIIQVEKEGATQQKSKNIIDSIKNIFEKSKIKQYMETDVGEQAPMSEKEFYKEK
jgi:hypothetical protein